MPGLYMLGRPVWLCVALLARVLESGLKTGFQDPHPKMDANFRCVSPCLFQGKVSTALQNFK